MTVALLILVQVLLVCARHLRGLLVQAVARGSLRLAQCFGSAQASFVLTHFTRGILRAIALERVLLARTAGQPGGVQPRPAAAPPRKRTPPVAHPTAPRLPRPAHDRLPGLPTLAQLEAAIRRRPAEAAIDDICHDLGVSFSLCEARFGNALRDMVVAYRGSLSNIFQQCLPRAAVAADAAERDPSFALPPQKPDAIRYILGCLGVQQPVCGFPFMPAHPGAAATGAQSP